MNLRFADRDLRLKSRTARKGFSFTEILFAVMILGIGFIMVAAMFPVALQQTENSTQETIGSSLARTGVRQMEEVAKSFIWAANNNGTPPYPTPAYSILVPTFTKRMLSESVPESLSQMQANPDAFVPVVNPRPVPPLTITLPGQVWSCNDERNWYTDSTGNYRANQILWSQVSHNMISAYDARYAWVALYKRDRTATYPVDGSKPIINDVPSAQVFVFATQVRNTQAYNVDSPGNAIPSDTAIADPHLYTASLQATLTTIGILPAAKGSGLPAKITVDPNGKARVAEGAFIVISDDSLRSDNFLHGSLNGHIYRIGTQDMTDTTGATWELAPGYSLSPTENDFTVPNMAIQSNAGFPAYIIGKGRDVDNPGDQSNPNFAGPAQDISVYTTFIQVNP